MHEESLTDMANHAVVEAVTRAIDDNPQIGQVELSAVATKVATAIAAGFAVVKTAIAPGSSGL